jgi:hypothetical protein
MPRGDETGPPSGGSGGGGAMGAPFVGPGGHCVCPSCGYSEPHIAGQPCNAKTCPKCGKALTREG